MGYIYKITNNKNLKVYIGLTRRSVENRWREHLEKAKNSSVHTKLYNAMRKYGVDNFSIETIEEVDNNILDIREQFWIKEYNSYENGYNSTIGGEGAQLYDYDLFLNSWKQGLSVDEIAQEYECNRNTVYYAIYQTEGWQEEALNRRKNNAISSMNSTRKIAVDAYDLKGNLIKTYESSRDAANDLNISESNLSRALHTKGRVDNYQFVKHNDPAPKPYVVTGSKGVDQYDLNDNFIAHYVSCKEAGRQVNGDSKSGTTISQCAKGRGKTAYGFKWKYSN